MNGSNGTHITRSPNRRRVAAVWAVPPSPTQWLKAHKWRVCQFQRPAAFRGSVRVPVEPARAAKGRTVAFTTRSRKGPSWRTASTAATAGYRRLLSADQQGLQPAELTRPGLLVGQQIDVQRRSLGRWVGATSTGFWCDQFVARTGAKRLLKNGIGSGKRLLRHGSMEPGRRVTYAAT